VKGACVRLLQNTAIRPVTAVSFGSGGRALVAGGSGGYDVWDVADWSHTFIASHAVKYHFGCVCDPAGRWVYVSDSLGGFRILPLSERDVPAVPGSPYELHVRSFDLAADGSRLVMSRGGYGSNRVECWNVLPSGSFKSAWSLRDGKPVKPDEPYLLNETTWSINEVAVSRDGKTVATHENRAIRGSKALLVVRKGAGGKLIAELGQTETSFMARLAVAPEGQTLYAMDDLILERWDVKATRLTHRIFRPGRAYFQGLVAHPFGRAVITVSGDGQVRYWDPADLSLIKTVKWDAGKLHAVTISPDGTLAAAGGEKGKVVLWDVDV
jgi:WD40 repeat protein